MNMTSAEYRQLVSRIAGKESPKPTARDDGYRSQWESDFARHLEFLRTDGKIIEWGYERIRLRIGKRSGRERMRAPIFTPDFHVIEPGGRLKFYEVKGYYRESAKVRSAVAAEVFPNFVFIVVRKSRGATWKIVETFNG